MTGKQITAKNAQVIAVYRIIGKDIYLKANNMMYAEQMIVQIQQKGGRVERGKGWLKIDIFGNNKLVKLGQVTIDLEIATNEFVEDVLSSFYFNTLKAQGFEVTMETL